MTIQLRSLFLFAFVWATTISAARADDWVIVKLSGDALVFYHGQWTKLRQGDVVADDAFVRTLANGAAKFSRDHETIDVEANTQIQIVDRRGERFTTVRQYFGTVGVEANVEKVKHFAVQTPYLAAVVKGTIFAVATQGNRSAVAVARGKVGVRSADHSAQGDILAGQTATVVLGHSMSKGASGATGATAAATAAAAASNAAAASTAAASTAAAPAAAAAAAASSASGAPGSGASSPGSSSSGASSSGSSSSGSSSSGSSSSGSSSSGSSSSGSSSSGSSSSGSSSNGTGGRGARGGDHGDNGHNGSGHGDGHGGGHGGGEGHGR